MQIFKEKQFYETILADLKSAPKDAIVTLYFLENGDLSADIDLNPHNRDD